MKSLDPCSKIIPGITPYFGVKLKVDLLLFSPKPDTLLGTILISHSVVVVVIRTCESINRVCVFSISEGKVLKVTPESIHAVVLGFSSVVITDKEIRDEFIYRKVSAACLGFETT